MARSQRTAKVRAADPDELRRGWVEQLERLVEDVQGWARGLDWSTRRIENKMEDPAIGAYKAPALILQRETVRVLMEPIARSTPGGEGLVDLYLLPAYDDIASLFFSEAGWSLHYPFPGAPFVGDIRQSPARPLTEESLRDVLEEMIKNAG